MTQEQETLLMIKGAIADLDPAQLAVVNGCLVDVRRRLAEAGDLGGYVVALIGAELAAAE